MRTRQRSDAKVKMSTATLKCTQCNIVINELLCFVQNKIDVLDEESLVRLVVTAFSTLEINAAKELLFASVTTTLRNVSRRKNKEQKDVEDIICALKNTEPDNTPIFVAWQLHKLPPVTFNSLDATKILKDILLLQTELKSVKESYATNDQLICLKSEIDNMRFASLVNIDNNVNNRRGAYLLDSGPTGILNFSNSSTTKTSTPEREATTSVEQPAKYVLLSQPQSSAGSASEKCTKVSFASCPVTMNNKLTQPDINTSCVQVSATIPAPVLMPTRDGHAPGTSGNRSAIGEQLSLPVFSTNERTSKSMAEILMQKDEWKPESPNEEWIKVQKRKHRNITEGITGKAKVISSDKFKPADLKIPLFISNVHKDTLEGDIVRFIFSKTKENVLLQKIKIKTKREYNAYKMIVSRNKLDLFLNDEIWPDGVTCRRFMPYKNPEQMRNLPKHNE